MGLSFTVGGARGTFDERYANEVAGVLDNAFGGEADWEGVPPRDFGELDGATWSDLQRRARETLGAEAVPNLLALGEEGSGVYLPTHMMAVSLPLPKGRALRCASLPGLRSELTDLAGRWELPLDDDGLKGILRGSDGNVAEAPEVLVFARLALAANEAVRKDCPLWLRG